MTEEPKKKLSGLSQIWRGFANTFSKNDSKVIYEGDSNFHHVTITEKEGIRTLHLGPGGQESETSISIANPEAPIFEYPGIFFLGLSLTPRNKNILMLGLGGGYIPNLFKKYLKNHHLTVIEIDPLIAELASTYFGFEPSDNVTLIISDGLEYVARAKNGHYDQIWLDAFNGNYIPAHMCDSDFLAMVKLKLAEGGLAIQNLHQTAWMHFRAQLEHTTKVFDQTPLLFAGVRSANTIAMSLNSDDADWPPKAPEIASRIKAFQPKVGPYSLIDEARKQVKGPSD
ncbi:MAG: fused MFS/spermidine synthase [Deltaproteobacteria bacterium]|jgi:spermidine synthase|nr:fused MFS/spermidine synthase [Deltaproteobacteria bacterium]